MVLEGEEAVTNSQQQQYYTAWASTNYRALLEDGRGKCTTDDDARGKKKFLNESGVHFRNDALLPHCLVWKDTQWHCLNEVKRKKANMSFCLLGIFNCQMVGCICSVFEWLNFSLSLSCTICLPQVRNTSVELAICWPNSGTRPSPKQHHLLNMPTLSPSAKWRWRHFGHLCHSSEHTGTHYLWGVIALVGN